MRIDSKLLLGSILTFVAVRPVPAVQEQDKISSLQFFSTATCPAKTVNHITHTLPQLCLASSRLSATNTTVRQVESIETLYLNDDEGTRTHEASTSSAAIPTPTISIELSTIQSSVAQGAEPSLRHGAGRGPQPTLAESDPESDLGNGKFLSFEDWKTQNLAKTGQSEHIGKARPDNTNEPRRKAASLPIALDSLGDDAEIDLDFSAFAAEKPGVIRPNQHAASRAEDIEVTDQASAVSASAKSRSKDAGTTCKERSNYASFDCAATVLKTNSQAKGPSAVLGENKDNYMLNECSADNKFMIIELCNDISIDTIVLANFEFFSSMVRTFRVSVSDRYPIKVEKWKILGTFEARNSREVQAFLVENPLIWARYLKVEFLTHYGNEYYCPLSLIRVHGTTMMDDYRHELESSKSDDDDSEDRGSNTADDGEHLVPEAIAQVLVEEEEARMQASSNVHVAGDSAKETASEPTETSSNPSDAPIIVQKGPANIDVETSPNNTTRHELFKMESLFITRQPVCSKDDETEVKPVKAITTKIVEDVGTSNLSVPMTMEGIQSQTASKNSFAQSLQVQASINNPDSSSEHVNKTSETEQPVSSSSQNATPRTTNVTQSESTKTAASSTQALPPSPTIQESFFKSVQKRLQILESSSSLSLQYIEEQSRNLRDAFGRVEQRQLAKTTTFLDYLNSTVLSELRDFRLQYDQLWQSTVIELETQREQYQQEVITINSRLAVLADEIIFQKRMSILQTVLVLLCLGLVLFSRDAMNNYLELPIVQNMLARSPSLKSLNSHLLQTPTESPTVTRPNSSHKQNPPYSILKRHRSQLSEDSNGRPPSPSIAYSPATPTSYDGGSDVEEADDIRRAESPTADLEAIVRSSSSPPTLRRMDDSVPEIDWDHTPTRLTYNAYTEGPEQHTPRVLVEEATPPTKRLSFRLPSDEAA